MNAQTALTTTTGKEGGLTPFSLDQARQYARQSKAESTLRGYRSDWREFFAWCESHNVCPLPATPESVAAYIAECAGHLKVGSIQRRINAIAEAHKTVNVDSPTHSGLVRATLKGIRRVKGTAPAQKAAALIDDIRAMVDSADAGLIGCNGSQFPAAPFSRYSPACFSDSYRMT
jgi:hypothetical protein